MQAWQITDKHSIQKIEKKEILDDVEFSKVKLTKVFLDNVAYDIYSGNTKVKFPIIPASFSVGIVSEFGNDDVYDFSKGSKVFISALKTCGECYECVTNREDKCSKVLFSGRQTDGMLKEFAIIPNKQLFALPPSVSDKDALFIDVIALAISTIDELDIQKGEHVLIIGSGVESIILSQIASYYKAIPIIVYNDVDVSVMADKVGVYYKFKADKDVEKEISSVTGGRMNLKTVYQTGCKIPTKLISLLSSSNAKVVFSGFDYFDFSLSFSEVMKKQLEIHCVKNGTANIKTAINLLATKAIDLSFVNFKEIKFNEIEKYFKDADKKESFEPCYVSMVEL